MSRSGARRVPKPVRGYGGVPLSRAPSAVMRRRVAVALCEDGEPGVYTREWKLTLRRAPGGARFADETIRRAIEVCVEAFGRSRGRAFRPGAALVAIFYGAQRPEEAEWHFGVPLEEQTGAPRWFCSSERDVCDVPGCGAPVEASDGCAAHLTRCSAGGCRGLAGRDGRCDAHQPAALAAVLK